MTDCPAASERRAVLTVMGTGAEVPPVTATVSVVAPLSVQGTRTVSCSVVAVRTVAVAPPMRTRLLAVDGLRPRPTMVTVAPGAAVAGVTDATNGPLAGAMMTGTVVDRPSAVAVTVVVPCATPVTSPCRTPSPRWMRRCSR